MPALHAITMPKWGMTMTEGRLVQWLVEVGAPVTPGQEILEIETDKIANAYEAPCAGVLRRRLVEPPAMAPVGALLAVLADAATTEAEIDAFIATQAERAAVAESAASSAPMPRRLVLAGGAVNMLSVGEPRDAAGAVLLIHGFGGDLGSWLFNQTALADGRCVHALDLPAHGASDVPQAPPTFESLVATVQATLEALEAPRVHLVGHSIGGAVAARVAASSSRVASLTLIGPAGLGPEIDMGFIDGLLGAERRAQMKPVLERLLADPTLVRREMIDGVLKALRADGVPAALRALAVDCFPHGRQRLDARTDLARLAMPVQVIWGQADRILPPAHAAGLSPAIAVHLLAAAGHMPHMEQAGRVNELLVAHFLTAERSA